jgi:hypothetical protein
MWLYHHDAELVDRFVLATYFPVAAQRWNSPGAASGLVQ